MIDKTEKPTKLLWVDLEMTGLDPTKDLILEIAAEVTDFDFKTLASYEATVNQPRELVVERMKANSWWADFPQNRDSFINKLSDGKSSEQVETDLIALVRRSSVPNQQYWLATRSITTGVLFDVGGRLWI